MSDNISRKLQEQAIDSALHTFHVSAFSLDGYHESVQRSEGNVT